MIPYESNVDDLISQGHPGGMAAIKGAKSVRALHATGARHTFSVNDIQTAVARRVSQSGELPRRGRPLTVTADTKVVIRDDHSKKKVMAFWSVVENRQTEYPDALSPKNFPLFSS